jgi:hypothetical protein
LGKYLGPDIKEYIGNHLQHLKYDKDLYLKILRFRVTWAQKDDDYIDFLGGNLTGVQPIRFSDRDEDNFYIDVLGIDKDNLVYDVKQYTKEKEAEEHVKLGVVGTNPMYQTIVYMMHRFINSSAIGKHKEDVLNELYYIFAYKVISSLISHYFSYNIDEATAKAVYERLSNRFMIKKLSSWQEVFEYRAKDINSPKGLHYISLTKLNTDEAISIIQDMQGRIRGMLKNIYAVMLETIEANEKIVSTTLIEQNEDGESTREIDNRPDRHINYIRSVINQPNDFIVDDYVYLMQVIIPNLDIEKFVETLKYISENLEIKPGSKDDFIEVVMNNTISYLRTKNITGEYNKKVLDILKYMKGYWSSSSIKDKDIKYTKKYLTDIAYKATNKKTKWLLATISISVMLYIFLRAIGKNK